MSKETLDKIFPAKINILDLSDADKVQIGEILQQREGGLRVFIHPFSGFHRITMTPDSELPEDFDLDQITYGIAQTVEVLDDYHRHRRSKDKPRICLSISEIVRFALGENDLADQQRKQLLVTHNNQPKAGDFRTATYNHEGTVVLTDAFISYLKKLVKIILKEKVILLAEASCCLDETIQAIRELGYTGLLLYYPTNSQGTPSPTEEISDLSRVATAISKLGAKKLIIGGQYASLMYVRGLDSQPNLPTPTVMRFTRDLSRCWIGQNCVGEFGEAMGRSGLFEMVNLSSASFPHQSPSNIYLR